MRLFVLVRLSNMMTRSRMFDGGSRHKCIGDKREIRPRVRLDFVGTATVVGAHSG
jgi:hypothetical protein